MIVLDMYSLLSSTIPELFDAAKATFLKPGVYLRHVDYSLYVKGTPVYNKEWKSWSRYQKGRKPSHSDTDRFLWTKCCVCQKVTPANLPWWKRVRYVRSDWELEGFYKPFVRGMWSIWGMCSDECLNMFYLGNDQ